MHILYGMVFYCNSLFLSVKISSTMQSVAVAEDGEV